MRPKHQKTVRKIMGRANFEKTPFFLGCHSGCFAKLNFLTFLLILLTFCLKIIAVSKICDCWTDISLGYSSAQI